MQYANQSLNIDVLVEQLRSRNVSVDVSKRPGMSESDSAALRTKLAKLKLPDDFLNFLENSNGVRIKYSINPGRMDQRSIPVGHFDICSSNELHPVEASMSWQHTDVPITAIGFERVPDLGVVCLVYRQDDHRTLEPSVWLRDNVLNWHYICRNFSCYYRLAMVHMAVARWQAMFTPQGLDNTTKAWLAKLNLPQLLHDVSQTSQLKTNGDGFAMLGLGQNSVSDIPQIVSSQESHDVDDQIEHEKAWVSRNLTKSDAKRRHRLPNVIDFESIERLTAFQPERAVVVKKRR